MIKPLSLAALLVAAAACAPRMEPVRPIYRNGQVVPRTSGATVEDARLDGEARRRDARAQADASAEAALAQCTASTCDALTRGELALGMTRDQVFAATGSTAAAWEERAGGRMTTLSALDGVRVGDAVAPVAMVTLEDGRVRSYAYREPQGLRLVASPADAGARGTARARAAALLRDGDELALAGRFTAALDRYDRADVIDADNPETTIRIARALDKLLRPREAEIRYQLFLHQMNLETIRAQGEAYAHLGAAIVEARERLIVLERGR